MGFGHPVYRTEDPRSALLKAVAKTFGGPRVDFAIQVEERVPVLLEAFKPGRALHTNLEWYAAIVMELCGIDRDLFTTLLAEETAAIREAFAPPHLDAAAGLFADLVLADECAEFLTLPAYPLL